MTFVSDLLQGYKAPSRFENNHLFYGDNFTIMQEMPENSVDLIYLDPPFNSQRTYNLIYRQITGRPVPEQEEAFCDAWELDAEKAELARKMPVVLEQYDAPPEIIQFWKAWITALEATQPRLLAYLVYMTYRLYEMRRILKPTGTIYLHCDPAASHYIKVMMDGVFTHNNFLNEIIWKRTSAHSSAKRYGPIHDTILVYKNGDRYTWNNQYQPYEAEYIQTFFDQVDATGRRWKRSDLTGAGTRNGETGLPWRDINVTAKGRHWAYPPRVLDELDRAGRVHWPKKPGGMPRLKQYPEELPGIPLQDIWTDVKPLHNLAAERLGYPTQKPQALLERIIRASSNEGDVVFDPFCGCGTAIYAAQANGRKWIGCDIAILSIQLVRDALLNRYGLVEGRDFVVDGVPRSEDAARVLFSRDPRQFQHWVVEEAKGFCTKQKAGDRGIDGKIYFDAEDGLKNMALSVKGGGTLAPASIRELRGILSRDADTELAGFISFGEPTRGMRDEAARAGLYEYRGIQYERIQFRTVRELLDGRGFHTPSQVQKFGWQKQSVLPL